MKRGDRIEVYVREGMSGGAYWWRIRGPNGRILAHSEQYVTAASARRSARAFGKRHGIPVVEAK